MTCRRFRRRPDPTRQGPAPAKAKKLEHAAPAETPASRMGSLRTWLRLESTPRGAGALSFPKGLGCVSQKPQMLGGAFGVCTEARCFLPERQHQSAQGAADGVKQGLPRRGNVPGCFANGWSQFQEPRANRR